MFEIVNRIGTIYLGLITIAIITMVLFSIQASQLALQGLVKEALLLGSASIAFNTAILFSVAVILLTRARLIKGLDVLSSPGNNENAQAIGAIVGLVVWGLVTAPKLPGFSVLASVLAVPSQFTLFATAAEPLNLWVKTFLVTLAAPIAEEALFLIALPTVIFSILFFLGRQTRMPLLANPVMQTIITIAIVAPLFALFHIANQSIFELLFISIVFRTIMIGAVFFSKIPHLLPIGNLTAIFAIYAHIINNINSMGGIQTWFSIMLFQAPGVLEMIIGIIAVGFILLPFFIVITNIRNLRSVFA